MFWRISLLSCAETAGQSSLVSISAKTRPIWLNERASSVLRTRFDLALGSHVQVNRLPKFVLCLLLVFHPTQAYRGSAHGNKASGSLTHLQLCFHHRINFPLEDQFVSDRSGDVPRLRHVGRRLRGNG